MWQAERFSRIRALLAKYSRVSMDRIIADLAVSRETVRRDLLELEALGELKRVHGGAVRVQAEAPIAERANTRIKYKRAIAKAAATLIESGQTLFLDAGSTNLALTEFLPEDLELTVATNAIDIAGAVLRRPDLRLIMIGGSVDTTVGGCVDTAAVQAVAQLNVDRCFLGACAVHPQRGIGAALHADALFKRVLMEVTRDCVVLAMNSKFEARAPHRACALADVDLLVVEHDAPAAFIDPLRAAGATLAVAAPAA